MKSRCASSDAFRSEVEGLAAQMDNNPGGAMKRLARLIDRTDPQVVAANQVWVDVLKLRHAKLVQEERRACPSLVNENSTSQGDEPMTTSVQPQTDTRDEVGAQEAQLRRDAADVVSAVSAVQRPDARWMTYTRAAQVLADRGLLEASTAVAKAGETIAARDQDDLLFILEALKECHFHGALQATLNHISEKVVAVLLELMMERREEAEKFWQEARQVSGLRREAKERRAKEAERQVFIFFPPNGLAALERLIKRNGLPDCILRWLPTGFVDSIRDQSRPATLLLSRLNPPRPGRSAPVRK